MRKLVFGINVSIDGCCDHAKNFNPDTEVHEYFARLMTESDVLVYGRKTYELMVPFWPDIAKNPSEETKEINHFAQAFDSVSKILVFSQSLKSVPSEKTTIYRGHLEAEIVKLKQENGKNISTGGVDLPSQLLKLGLIDEIHLVVHPIVIGSGRRLFDQMDLKQNLNYKIADSKIFKSGCIALRYVKL